MVVIDTSILIDYFRRPEEKNSPFLEFNRTFPLEKKAISVLTIQELYSGKSSREPKSERLFLEVIGFFEILPYIYETAELAGKIVRDLDKSMGFPDAAIAATTILNKAKLLTLNKIDFQVVKGLKLI